MDDDEVLVELRRIAAAVNFLAGLAVVVLVCGALYVAAVLA